VTLTTQSNPLYAAAACSSPARMDTGDAAKITIPICILTSEEESDTEVSDFVEALKVEHYIERFAGQKHGWMTARGDLGDDKVKEAYKRGYSIMLDFFGKQQRVLGTLHHT
jgi:dienelactone hydrolase